MKEVTYSKQVTSTENVFEKSVKADEESCYDFVIIRLVFTLKQMLPEAARVFYFPLKKARS